MQRPTACERAVPKLQDYHGRSASSAGKLLALADEGGRRRPANVRLWHRADMLLELGDVCFKGESGHRANI
jgi:hypothetical protein